MNAAAASVCNCRCCRMRRRREMARAVAASPKPVQTPVKQYVIERMFGVRRVNGGFL